MMSSFFLNIQPHLSRISGANALAYIFLLLNLYSYYLTREEFEYFQIYYIISSLVLFGFAFTLHVMENKRFQKNNTILIILLLLFLLCSYAFNGFQHGRIALFMISFGYYFLFCVLPKYKLSKLVGRTLILFFLYLSLLPIVLYLVLDLQNMISEDGQFFIGFAQNHSEYGFIAGATILILLIRKTRWSYCAIPFLFYGLIISQSRSSIVATLISSLYLLINPQGKKAKVFLVLITAVFLLVIGYQLQINYGTIDTERSSRTRYLILAQYLEFISEHPFWGYGGDYQEYFYNEFSNTSALIQAHNSILQISANFGLIVLVLFLILYFYNMARLNIYGRVFFIYIFIIGMFQPELGVGITPFFSIMIICAMCYHQYGIVQKYRNTGVLEIPLKPS